MKRFVRAKWGDETVVKISMLNTGIFMLNFAEEEKKIEILLGGSWTFDNRPLILKEWSEQEDYKCGSAAALPIWVRLQNIKAHVSDLRILSKLCSKLGRPICTDGITTDGSSYSFARVCVEVFGEVELVDSIEYEDPYGNNYVQPVLYEWKPLRCVNCYNFGHLKVNCLEPNLDQMIDALKEKEMEAVKEKDKREAVEEHEEIEVIEETLIEVAEEAEEDVVGEESSEKLVVMAERVRKEAIKNGRPKEHDGIGAFKLILSKSAQKRARQKEKRNSADAESMNSKSAGNMNNNFSLTSEVMSRRTKNHKEKNERKGRREGGDFNCVLSRHEKRNGTTVREGDIHDLKKFVNRKGLLDLDQGGCFYSWNNNSKNAVNRVWCKLDRAMGNERWFEEFLDAKAIFMLREFQTIVPS
ncbi:hypothetical protein QQ045_028438 [Rhodiola kirilowii]